MRNASNSKPGLQKVNTEESEGKKTTGQKISTTSKKSSRRELPLRQAVQKKGTPQMQASQPGLTTKIKDPEITRKQSQKSSKRVEFSPEQHETIVSSEVDTKQNVNRAGKAEAPKEDN